MGKYVDMTGQRYGSLVAVKPTEHRTKSGGVIWLFKCDCGNSKIAPANSVRTGLIKSCGCLQKKHQMTKTQIYNAWVNMRQRCQNPKHPQFYLWGGKGVTVCSEWLGEHGAENFINWAMANGYEDGLTLDRIDGNGNYEPSNCRWATPKEQANNISRNHKITIDGKTMTLSEWVKTSPITESTYHKRKNKGWSDKDALFTPSQSRNGFKKHKNGD